MPQAFTRRPLAAILIGLLMAAACGRDSPREAAPASVRPPRRDALPSPAARPRVVFLGDSLTAGYGLAAAEAYPSLV
ncbi:MAG: hypothetical protein H6Q09_1522, partial [Acidobacteria bacterium]|nr:hypothetical protein [Acidobacteriota bacterium]